jgi:chitinase
MHLNIGSFRKCKWVASIVVLSFFPAFADASLWTSGYYPGWEQSSMPASDIDFSALTHVIHFSLVPNSNGSLNSSDNGITAAYSADLISRAHAAGTKVIICVGGAGSESDFQAATSTATLPVFIKNLTNFVATYDYDGVDIDWEPLPASDFQQFTNLVNGLRSALDGFAQHELITIAAAAYPPYGDPPTAEYAMFAALQNQLDQINIMTYDLSGPYGGWVTWFNSPIYDGGYTFPSTGGPVPSVNGAVDNFLGNGVSAAKLGVGIAFYGYIWSGGSGTSTSGVTQPRQSWTTAPTVSTPDYNTIMSGYYQPELYHWDSSAQAAYLSITNVNPASDMFISYDDQRTCQSKVSYARNRSLGGVMIWELAQDFQAGQPDPLLEAVKQSLAAPGLVNLQPASTDVVLTFNGIALGSYSVQWTSNFTAGVWNTLLITNVLNAGGVLKVIDPAAILNQPQRFYRVKTPP